MISPIWIPFNIGRMRLNIDFVAFPSLFGVLPLIDMFSFGKQGHLRARGEISTGVLSQFSERRTYLSKMIAELGEFLFLTRSLAGVHSLLYTVLSYRRGLGHFRMPGGGHTSIARLPLLPKLPSTGGSPCYDGLPILCHTKLHH